jgi:hypothetical protein
MLTLSEVHAGLYSALKYISFNFTITSPGTTLVHNDTIHPVHSMTLQPSSTATS